jgi:aspartate kinase
MIVQKFGGTSVGKPERMHHVAALVNDNKRKIVVLSAVSGTTNALVKMGATFMAKKDDEAKALVKDLYMFYNDFITKLYTTPQALAKGQKYIDDTFHYLGSFTSANFGVNEERIFLAQGELISTHLMSYYMEEKGMSVALIPALEFMRSVESEPDMKYIEENIKKFTDKHKENILLTQGYICLNEFGQIDNLKRGGSDYTASIVGAAVRAEVVEIWTDIDGMHNNDPRIVKGTTPVHEISFDEAAELAYFGAKILHPTCIVPAQQRNIPVKLLNTMEPQAKGTTITEKTTPGLKAVAAKDGITVIHIKSTRMFLAYGFLSKVFAIFEKYKTSIDMITTSEVSVSLSIDNTTNLAQIQAELEKFCLVEVETDQTIVCVVGQFEQKGKSVAVKVLEVLEDLPISMISYGGSKNNVSILLPSQYRDRAMIAIHEGVFLKISNKELA